MNKVDFSSFYKFLVSLGILLITAPFIILNFLFKDNDSLLIKSKELSALPKTAQAVISNKQELYSTLVTVMPWLCILLFIIGIVIVVKGSILWYQMQKVDDDKKRMENKELKQRIEPMTQIEIESKVSEEMNLEGKEEYFVFNDDTSRTLENKTIDLDDGRETRLSSITKYLKVEKKAISFINRMYSENYNITGNVKIGDMNFDVLAASRDESPDLIFEIKYYKQAMTLNRMKMDLLNINESCMKYEILTGRKTTGFLFIVIENEIPGLAVSLLRGFKQLNKWENIITEVKTLEELS